ncbi:MAG: InlB B-repeat-containing protein, partial [Alphaproteobacteria bacterium]|nr:InlB B-repeat-containing protein [Alphaproteobacteria bacterium]
TSPNTVMYGGSFNVLSYADTNLSSTGYTFQNWNTAADGSGTDYAPNASFTMNDCAVSGTTIDLYAKCECDNANNWWWNADNTACVRGYTIQLKILPEYATPEPTYPTAPTTLYTIPTRGAYLDAARTLLMTKTSNPIQLPYLEFMLNFDTNTPVNPVNNTQYSVPNVDSINMAGWYHCFAYPNMTGGIYTGHGWSSSTCFIHNTPNNYTNTAIRNLTSTNRDGYLTDQGIYEAENQYQNQTWYINGKGWEGSHYADNPTLTGYTFVNWCTDPENTTSCFKGQVPDNVQNHIYYAHWTPNTYDVVYNPGAHAASGSTSYTDTDGATYDSPYMPLSFGASPISDNMSAGTGYVFVGWTTDSTPTFTNGNLDNEYTGDTYWKRDSGLTLYAAYACDSENGYHLVNGECVLNTYTVTYYSGNCDPNNVENLFGNTYSATDSNLAVSGQPYNVLSYTNTSLVGDNFGQMYSDNGFGVPYACASFHGWNDPNIQGTDIDYNNCFSEQNGLCTPVIQSYSYEDNLNLYAYCKWDTWNVAYYGCDGELIKTESLKFGDSFLVPSASDISGYTFNGWIFKSGGNNINLGDTFPADLCLKGYNPLNLYADCTLNVYPVNLIWVANGESFPNQSTCDYGTGTISDISHPDLPGYRFTGWKVTNWE